MSENNNAEIRLTDALNWPDLYPIRPADVKAMINERDEARRIAEHFRDCLSLEVGYKQWMPWEGVRYKPGRSTMVMENKTGAATFF